jgi:hypothetical protein
MRGLDRLAALERGDVAAETPTCGRDGPMWAGHSTKIKASPGNPAQSQ